MKKLTFLNKIFWLFVALSASAVVFNSCDDDNEPGGGGNDCGEASTITTNPGVVINGVKWATTNVDVPGTFAFTPESPGKFYQWNRRVAWCATFPGEFVAVPNWDTTLLTGTEWTRANDPSPVGWRVPTFEEIQKLLDTSKVNNEWTTQNGVNGRKFTDKSTNASLFLPAVGDRDHEHGMLFHSGTNGNYWSSTKNNIYTAVFLEFNNSRTLVLFNNLQYGLPVRSVAE